MLITVLNMILFLVVGRAMNGGESSESDEDDDESES